ncbi:MAG: ABC transporter ATP-binding protein [Roseofilum sp. SBFL]|uniref:ABC transporter ATP-binding protein n=1 Tax=unclassified Roseofilum TaxID=2620099 RepID=UPI001B07FDAB|nr:MULTISPECIES: ABC transporter ATP-binding protein [unclassified Roseofilum]MBP0012186.1 ABC transporter ATP-binding protein [Roseofilum sp. SID3]MBP0024815.1 ABC transporter ATP-binding protein [Roseofilum sp. SID2]MBP0039022.1 ABC transporter ATP-binding protein [Roseofilum sp. SID1]MBP0043633.1 ABC transporter ATP-binding protein [Roseofilum sp. SBFL]
MSSREFVFKYLKKYPIPLISNIILGFSGAIFNGVNTALIIPVVLQIVGQEVELKGAPPALKFIFAPFEGIPEQYRLGVMLAAIILTIILKEGVNYLRAIVAAAFKRRMTNCMKIDIMSTLLETDIDFYSKNKLGDITKRLGGDTTQTTTAINSYVDLTIYLITSFFFLSFLVSLSWQLTVISTLMIVMVAVVNQGVVKRSKQLGKEVSNQQRMYSIKVLEVLGGIRLVKSVGNEQQEFGLIKRMMLKLEKFNFLAQSNSALIKPLSEITNIFTVISILLVGRAFFSSQLENLSAILLTYLFVLFRMMPVVNSINGVRNTLAKASASVDFAYDIWRRDNKPIMTQGIVPFNGFQDKIHFKEISFAYPGHNHLVIKKADLVLPRGKSLALVGSSGAGKSTFADLLPRFYDPTEGSILIDGRDIREFELRSLRKSMGIVSQTTFLFNDTVRNNIIYARPDATEDEMVTAAKQANAYDFIMQLPKQWETEVGDRGVMLSGGQRQRLAIARALLQDPDILILDEATSALDTVSERIVQEAIDHLSRDRTTLVIAHRLSTIQNTDQIAVLDKGQVMEVGTHQELLEKKGLYHRLHSMQFSETEASETTGQKRIDYQTLSKASYEARTQLNSMIGSLRLLADEIVDTPEEQLELTEEAYRSAINLLRTFEVFENKLR